MVTIDKIRRSAGIIGESEQIHEMLALIGQVSNTDISVYGHSISIIGSFEQIKLVENAPKIIDFLSSEDTAHFSNVLNKLETLKIPYIIDNYLVRGMDYYSRTVFEIQTNNLIHNNSLKCENILNLKKNADIKIIERNDIKYSSLNNYIKENITSINDFLIFKKNNINIYVLLCDIKYNDEYFENININEKINLIVKNIENDLVINKSKKYNFYKKQWII